MVAAFVAFCFFSIFLFTSFLFLLLLVFLFVLPSFFFCFASNQQPVCQSFDDCILSKSPLQYLCKISAIRPNIFKQEIQKMSLQQSSNIYCKKSALIVPAKLNSKKLENKIHKTLVKKFWQVENNIRSFHPSSS